jgi:hypothetical protein
MQSRPILGSILAIAQIAAIFAVPSFAEDASCKAEVFVLDNLKQRPPVMSPDGRYRVELSGDSRSEDIGTLTVFEHEKRRRSFPLKDLSAGMFVKWAPDSKGFYFMWSDGGATGAYEVRVFEILKSGIKEVAAVDRAHRYFKSRHACVARGDNVFALRWIENSQKLLLGFEVYPIGDCGKELGYTEGFLVRTSDGAILHRYSEKDLVHLVPKGCPADIWPTALWNGEELKESKSKAK